MQIIKRSSSKNTQLRYDNIQLSSTIAWQSSFLDLISFKL